MSHRAELAAIVLLLATAAQAAGEPARGKVTTRPTGPVTVTADRAEWEQGGPMRYLGHVALSSETLQLKGDSLDLKQLANGDFDARVAGGPATLDHAGTPGATGPAAQAVSARARQMNYNSATGVVELVGDARLTRGSDEIVGESIRYDVNARRIRAAGGDAGQVKIVIQPPPMKETTP
ncbi:MAG TPA: LptA/OstA family protein [Solimonas sp.]|nr:LptA/OstA family protein [Solimonas sp.]